MSDAFNIEWWRALPEWGNGNIDAIEEVLAELAYARGVARLLRTALLDELSGEGCERDDCRTPTECCAGKGCKAIPALRVMPPWMAK